jgi:hypothetical protein
MWLFIGLPILAIFCMGLIHVSESLEDIRMHWENYRCNPLYMPFAGVIRPDIGTAGNFNLCMNSMAHELFKYIIDGVNLQFGILGEGLKELSGPLPLIRELFTRIRKFMLSFASQTFGKIASSMSVIVVYLIKIRDILKRFVGEGYIATFLVNAGIDFTMSFVYLCITVIKIFVYSLLAISIILALFQPELLAFAITIASLLAASGFS